MNIPAPSFVALWFSLNLNTVKDILGKTYEIKTAWGAELDG